MRCTWAKRRAGFTLFETMVAMALTIVLLGATFLFLFDLGTRRNGLLDRSRSNRGAALLLERLESDLLCTLAGDAGVGAGIKGSRTSISLLTRGVNLDEVPSGDARNDLCRATFSFESEAGRFVYGRQSIGQQEGTQAVEPIMTGVADAAFRYFDGRNWTYEFDSLAAGELPGAVEVSVWIGKRANAEAGVARPAPDFCRVIGIADGPGAAWKRGP